MSFDFEGVFFGGFIGLGVVGGSMSKRVKIKVHDVLHDREDYDVSAAEEYIESWITGVDVADVRVASGDKNSPLFITLNKRSISVDGAKSIARDAVRGFSEFVDDVDVDRTVRDDNVRVISEVED